MKIKANKIFPVLCVLLVIVNIYIFVTGVALGENVSFYEKEVVRLKQENIEIEQKIYGQSLTKTALIAAELDFDDYNEPIFTDKPQYAFNK